MTSARLPLVDQARGLCLWAMVAFHLTWDLAHFGWIDSQFPFTPGFRWFGHAIAAGFLLLAGFSLVLARGQSGAPLWRRASFWRRWLRLAAAALAISLVSLKIFPEAPIFFGILHCIALASLIALAFLDAPPLLTALAGGLSLAAPLLASSKFDAPMLWWTGLSSFYPPSNDYRPLFPWLGLVLIGVALGGWAARLPRPVLTGRGRGVRGWGFWLDGIIGSRTSSVEANAPAPHPGPLPVNGERGRFGPIARALGFCGRHSLAFYLIHQPILFGLLAAVSWAAPPLPPSQTERAFVDQCIAQCESQGAQPKICVNSCACVVKLAKADHLWQALAQDQLTEPQKIRLHDAAIACYADAAGQN